MAEKAFKQATDLASYAEDLRQYFGPRDRRLMERQAMWEMCIRETPGKRTVYKSNEPWKATRLTVSLLDQGKDTWRVTLPPDLYQNMKEERDVAVNTVIEFLKALFAETDQRRDEEGEAAFNRAWAYSAAIYGWDCGIALVKDGVPKGEWPVFVDLWNPLDTYRDMKRGAEGIVHFTTMTYADVLATFGPGRKGGKIKGYEFDFAKEDAPDLDEDIAIAEFFGKETHAVAAMRGGEPKWLKPQMEHFLGCNPAHCVPLDAPPIRHTVTSEKDGKVLKTGRPDSTSSRWLENYGQSPMHGYEIAYRVKTERMNQVGDVMERWANPKMVAKTPDGKLVKIDLSNPESIANIPSGVQLELLTPSTFPTDQRAYFDILDEDVATASYSPAAYGLLSSSDAATAMQMARQSSGFIAGPMAKQLQARKASIANKIFTQMEKKNRKKTYKEIVPVRTMDEKSSPIWTHLSLADVPDGCRVTCELRGAGMQPDKLQAAVVATQIANAQTPVYDLQTIHDEILQTDNPPEVIQRLLWQRLTQSKEIEKYAGPIATLLFLADNMRAKDTERSREVANYYESMAMALQEEMKAQSLVTGVQAKTVEQQALQMLQQLLVGANAAGNAIAGAPAAPAPEAAAQGGGQMEGVSAPGAPPAGVQQAPTGPAPERGAQMVQSNLGF